MKSKKEDILIKGCKEGDSECQEKLFYEYSELLFAICKRYLGNYQDAEDILQDSFIRIFDAIDQFDPKRGSLKNWLIAVCVNKCINKLNRQQHKISLDQIGEFTNNFSIEAEIDYQELYQLIIDLPIPYRTVVNLYMVEGYSHKEIGKLLEIKDSSSRSILTRAKKMLQEKIHLTKNKETWQT